MMKVIFVLAAALACVHGKTFVWNGGNNNFGNCNNWDGPCPNGEAPVGVDLNGANGEMVGVGVGSSDTTKTLAMGDYLKFPEKVTIKFGTGTYTLKFSDGSSASNPVQRRGVDDGVAEWIPPSDSNVVLDPTCSENYLTLDSENNLVPAEEVACGGGDNIVSDDLVALRIPTGTPPILINSLTIAGTKITESNCDSMLTAATCSNIHFLAEGANELQECDNLGILSGGECDCAQIAKRPQCQPKEIDLDLIEEQENEKDETAPIKFKLEIPVSDFVTTVYPTVTDLEDGLNGAMADLLTQLKDDAALGFAVPDANTDDTSVTVSLSESKDQIVVEGTLTTQKRVLIGLGIVNQADHVTDNMEVDVGSIPSTIIKKSFTKTTTELLVAEPLKKQQEETDAAKENIDLSGCEDCPSVDEVEDTVNDVTEKFDDPTTVIDASKTCAEGATQVVREQCVDDEVGTLIDDGTITLEEGVTEEDAKKTVKDLTEQITDLEEGTGSSGGTGTSPVDTLIDALVDGSTRKKELEEVKNSVSVFQMYTSQKIVVGEDLDAETKLQIVKLPDIVSKNVADTLHKGGWGFYNVRSVETKLNTGSRRRSATLPMSIQFVFDALCTQQEISDGSCNPLSNSVTNSAMVTALNNMLLLFKISDHAEELCLEESTHTTCCLNKADGAYAKSISAGSSTEQATTDAAIAVKSCLQCGSKPSDGSGNCPAGTKNVAPNIDTLATNAANLAASSATTAAPTTAAPTTAQKSSEDDNSSSGIPIAVVAGAAAGAILIIAIVAFVLYKRQGAGSSSGGVKAVDDRNVVAFENPMYDNPADKAAAAMATNQPIYEDGDGADGLYDEPAFNQMSSVNKSNPMYASAEHIEGFGDEDAGYLDAEGADTGYLDVAPDDN